jgi:hypothetical protein
VFLQVTGKNLGGQVMKEKSYIYLIGYENSGNMHQSDVSWEYAFLNKEKAYEYYDTENKSGLWCTIKAIPLKDGEVKS